MDGTTEPVVAVIGYPIAGNPTQFALETGFAAAGIDCRVLSIGLSEDALSDALNGMLAMRFRGVWIDSNLRSAITALLRSSNSLDDVDQGTVESLVIKETLNEDSSTGWKSLRLVPSSWTRIVADRCPIQVITNHEILVIGEDDDRRKEVIRTLVDAGNCWGGLSPERIRTYTRYVSTIATDKVSLVILTSHIPNRETMIRRIIGQGDIPLVVIDRVEDWQAWQPMTFGQAKSDSDTRPFVWIDSVEIHAATLVELCKVWLEAEVPAEVLRDAIEEYLAM